MPLNRHQGLAFLLSGLLVGLLAGMGELRAQARADTVTYVTRGEAAQLLLKRSLRVIPDIVNNGAYPDVIDGEPYAKYVLYAAQIGMWPPEPATDRLRPHKPITRGEFLQMLAAVFGLDLNMPFSYRDMQAGSWDSPYAGIAQQYNIFYDQRDSQRLRSELPITHEDAATALYTLFAQRPDLRTPQRIMMQKVVYEDTNDRRAQAEQPDRNVLNSYVTVTSRDQILQSIQNEKNQSLPVAENIEQQIIGYVNVERAKAGLGPLTANKTLQASATLHAKDMSERSYFSHFTPEGKSFVDRIKEAGYTDVDPIACGCKQVLFAEEGQDLPGEAGPNYAMYSKDVCRCQPKFALGENIAKGQLTADQVMREWMDSESHRKNILQPAFREIGVGIFRDLWVQNFGEFELVLP